MGYNVSFSQISAFINKIGNTLVRSYGIIIAHQENKQIKEFESYVDYRGVEVMGTQTTIPELQWSVIVEQDTDEVFATLN